MFFEYKQNIARYCEVQSVQETSMRTPKLRESAGQLKNRSVFDATLASVPTFNKKNSARPPVNPELLNYYFS